MVDAWPHRRAQRDDEEQRRKDHRQLDRSGDDRVDPAAVVAREGPEEDPDDHHPQRGEDRDLERGARAVDQAQELVVAEHAVGAEDVELLRGRVPDAVRRRDREARALDVRQGPDRQAQDGNAAWYIILAIQMISFWFCKCTQTRIRKRNAKSGMFSSAPGQGSTHPVATIPVTRSCIYLL